jgi:hypothetical protein
MTLNNFNNRTFIQNHQSFVKRGALSALNPYSIQKRQGKVKTMRIRF